MNFPFIPCTERGETQLYSTCFTIFAVSSLRQQQLIKPRKYSCVLPSQPPAGFWNHEDVTRPFVSQAVITDGKYFSFFCYQLNTVALSVETDSNNPRKNLMWGTESLRLYDSVQDGAVVGLNDGVIKLLVQFFMNQP